MEFVIFENIGSVGIIDMGHGVERTHLVKVLLSALDSFPIIAIADDEPKTLKRRDDLMYHLPKIYHDLMCNLDSRGPLKSWAADFFYSPKIPWVKKYKPKPFILKQAPIKQPVSSMGFLRGQRKVNLTTLRREQK